MELGAVLNHLSFRYTYIHDLTMRGMKIELSVYHLRKDKSTTIQDQSSLLSK